MAYDYCIGRILRAHGLHGAVTVQLFRPRDLTGHRPEKHREKLALGEVEHTIRSVEPVGPDRARVRFEGVEDRDAADRLEGVYVYVDPAVPPRALTDDLDRLFGADVVDRSGAPIGEIVDIRDNGAQPLLVVGEEEILIPAPFLVEVRAGARTTAVVDPPEGLLELARADRD